MAKAKNRGSVDDIIISKDEQLDEIPSNWSWVKLGGIAAVKGGKRVPKGKKLSDDKTEHPYIRVTDMSNGTIDLADIKYVDDDIFSVIHNYTISSKDVYISVAGSIGKIGIIPECLEGANLTENAAKITNIVGTDNKYIMMYLQSDIAQIQMMESTISTTQPKLALFRIENINVPLPPLAEQKRIVEQIENLFTKLEKAKEKAIEALDSIEIRKKSIYAKAFNGELSKSWRSEKGIENKEWKTIPFEKVVINKDSVRIPLSQAERDNIAKIYDYYGASGVIDKVDNYLFDGKYLLIGEDGANLVTRSKPIAFIAHGKFWVNNHAHIFEMKDFMNMDYLCHYINSIDLIPYVTGSAQPKLSQKMMNKIPVLVPSLEEQIWITSKVDEMFLKEDEVEANIEKFIEQIDLMKKSILAKAFRGELGTNIADEESSIELLKTIIEV